MADEDDARGNVGPDEFFAPSGPRRSSYTPPSNDPESLEAAASVFDDDDIAAAMAAELAKVASGPIPIVRPNTGAQSEPSEPSEPVVPVEPEISVEPDVPVAEVEPVIPVTDDFAPEPASVSEPSFTPAPDFAAEQAFAAEPGFEPQTVTADAADEVPPPYIGAPAPTVPPAYAPPPPGYESTDAYFPPAPPEPVHPAETPADLTPPPPRRSALDDEELFRSLHEDGLSPAATLEVIGQLQAQLELRQREAKEFSEWEESTLRVGTPDAVAAVERARAEFSAPTRPAAEPIEEQADPADAVSTTPPTSVSEPAPPVPSSFAPESPSAPEPGYAPTPQPEPAPEPSTDESWLARWAPSTEPTPSIDLSPTTSESSDTGLPPAWEPNDTASGEPLEDGSFVLPVITDPPVVPAAPETPSSTIWSDEPVFRFAQSEPGAPSVPEAAAEPFAIDEPLVDEPSLEGTAFADLLASAPPPDPQPVPEPQVGPGSAGTSFADFGTTPETSFTSFDEPVVPPVDEPAPTPVEAPSDPPPFDSLFDSPAAGGDTVADPFIAPPFLAPPAYLEPEAPSASEQPTFVDPLTFNGPPTFAPHFDAPPPPDSEAAQPGEAPVAEAQPPAPPYSPPPLVEPPTPSEIPPEFSSQVGVVPDFGTPSAAPASTFDATPAPPTPFAEPTPIGETAQPAPFTPPAEVPDAPPPPPANFDALLAGGGDEGSPPPPDGAAQAATPDPFAEPAPDAPTAAPVPFGEGVARDEAVDPSDSIFGSSLGPVAVDPTGVAVIPETVAVEPQVAAVPWDEPITGDAPVEAAVPVIAAAPKVFKAELSGEEPTPVDQRVGRAARLFWLWFASNSSIVAVAFGGVIFALGMSLRQAIVATLVGIALSFVPLGLATLAGKRSGQPTMVISRATFGVVGNVVPAIIGLVSRLFWGAALLWLIGAGAASILTTAKATDGFNEQELTFIMMVFAFIIAIVIAYFGYALIARVQLVISIISGIFLVGFIALTAQYIDMRTALTTGDGSWVLAVTGAVLVFSFVGLVWANSGSDLARYQRPGSLGATSMLWATFGTALPSFVLIAYGALLAASSPRIAAGIVAHPLTTLGTLLPGWYPGPLLLATALSLVSGAVVAIYSAGFGLQSVGVRLRRPAAAIVAGILVLVIALVLTISVSNFSDLFRDFATTIAVPVAAWAGLFASEIMIRNRRFDSGSLLRRGGVYADVRWSNLGALVVITALGLGLTSATVSWLGWEGYLFGAFGVSSSSDLAATDLGVVVALILGIIFPIVAGVPAIRRQESTTLTAE